MKTLSLKIFPTAANIQGKKCFSKSTLTKKYKEANRNDVEQGYNNSGGPFLPPIPTSIAVVGDFKRDHMMRAAKNMVFSLTMAQP